MKLEMQFGNDIIIITIKWIVPVVRKKVHIEKPKSKSNNMEIAHIIPDSKGGSISLSNLIPICRGCNKDMGNTNFLEWVYVHYTNHLIDIIQKLYQGELGENTFDCWKLIKFVLCYYGCTEKGLEGRLTITSNVIQYLEEKSITLQNEKNNKLDNISSFDEFKNKWEPFLYDLEKRCNKKRKYE